MTRRWVLSLRVYDGADGEDGVYALAEKLGGDIEAAIRQLAERRRREREA